MAVVEMTDEQRHYTEIADRLESYSEQDKLFILWELLGEYRANLAKDFEGYSGSDTLKDYLEKRMLKDHMRYSEEIRDVLMYSIF